MNEKQIRNIKKQIRMNEKQIRAIERCIRQIAGGCKRHKENR